VSERERERERVRVRVRVRVRERVRVRVRVRVRERETSGPSLLSAISQPSASATSPVCVECVCGMGVCREKCRTGRENLAHKQA
jgi:hypothetical protein